MLNKAYVAHVNVWPARLVVQINLRYWNPQRLIQMKFELFGLNLKTWKHSDWMISFRSLLSQTTPAPSPP